MKNKEIVQDLRRLADAMEAMGETECVCDIDVYFYDVVELATLRKLRPMMTETVAKSSGDTHWIKGSFAKSLDVTAFYKSGLLGTVTKKLVEVECETEADLSLLEPQLEKSNV